MAREVCAFLKGLQIENTEVKCEVSWRRQWPLWSPKNGSYLILRPLAGFMRKFRRRSSNMTVLESL